MVTTAEVDKAIAKSMERVKSKLMRTKSASKKDISLADKLAFNKRIRVIECQLRRLRLSVFDVEDAAYALISAKEPGVWTVSGFYYLDKLMQNVESSRKRIEI